MPSDSPLTPIKRMGLTRICSLTRRPRSGLGRDARGVEIPDPPAPSLTGRPIHSSISCQLVVSFDLVPFLGSVGVQPAISHWMPPSYRISPALFVSGNILLLSNNGRMSCGQRFLADFFRLSCVLAW